MMPRMRRPPGRTSWRSGGSDLRRPQLLARALAVGFLALAMCSLSRAQGNLESDTQALLRFQDGVDRAKNQLPWNSSVDTCQWEGITCSKDVDRRVNEVRRPGARLGGEIPWGSLGQLSELRVLSLRNNAFSGGFDAEFSKLTKLRAIYLQDNRLSGALPTEFSSLWPGLVHVDLSNNEFTGELPASVGNLKKLKALYLQNNTLQGPIPAWNFAAPVDLNLANNNLSGAVPPSLSRLSADRFAGNALLCGTPLASCATGSKSGKKLSTGAIVAIIVGDLALLILITAAGVFCFWKRKSKRNTVGKDLSKSRAIKSEEYKDESYSSIQEPERNRLIFFEPKRFNFDLEDLLRASAEVLGKGSVGTAYKAVLEDGSIVAVKRLKDVSTGAKEFEQQIQLMGRLQHPNLVPLRAYYYSKDEKLLVYDYLPMGSLSALLHGNRGAGRTPLDWVSRVRIALGAARGIAHLHDEAGSNKFTHGNIKSSNILLSRNFEACVSDFGLVQLLSSTPFASRVVGYRAPEVTEARKVTQRADVYSFGVLLLELLTGKAPTQSSLNDEGIDLPRWVQSVVREEWTAEVFDLELMRYQNIEEEMVQMLQIAMACVATSPDQRPKMRQVLKMVEDIRPTEADEARKAYNDKSEKAQEYERPEVYTAGSEASDSFTPSGSFQS